MAEAIDFRESMVRGIDPGNKDIVNQINSKTMRMMMFTTTDNAAWITAKTLKREGYAFAVLTFLINRNFFRLDVGDLFKISYSPYSISNMICRVMRIREENLLSENIIVDVIEDIDYISNAITIIPPTGSATPIDYTLDPLINVRVIEAPYLLIGDNIGVVPLAARETGTELGYFLYMSIDDGASYNQIGTIPIYNPYGTLVAEYSDDTYDIDDKTGFEIDFSNNDVSIINTITRTHLFTGTNTALLGDEIISFQTITPVSGDRYKIENIIRGQYDTIKTTHNVGTAFYYIGASNYRTIQHNNILIGTSRKFKLLPYNSKYDGDISEASVESLTIEGRAKKPYMPLNLLANDKARNSTYTNDVILDWDTRLRTEGAGIGSADVVTDTATTWEGYFKIEVWVSGSKVRTTTDIDAATWTYTSTMNTTDNGSLANIITFKLSNYIFTGGVTYESDQIETIVTKE